MTASMSALERGIASMSLFAASSYSRTNGTERLISNLPLPISERRRNEAPWFERSAAIKTLVSMTICGPAIVVSYTIPFGTVKVQPKSTPTYGAVGQRRPGGGLTVEVSCRAAGDDDPLHQT